VFLNWWSYSYPVTGGTVTIYLWGTETVAGGVAAVAGIGAMLFGAAWILLPGIRRITAVGTVVCAFALVLASIVGLGQAGDAVGATPALPGVPPGGTVTWEAGPTLGLYLSFFVGLLCVAAAVLLVMRTFGDGPAN
jgi:hypothetical protein